MTTADEDLASRCSLQIHDGVATLTLTRPAAGNCLDLAMAEALHAAVTTIAEQAEAREVRAVVLQAQGSMFCAGGDLTYFASAADRSAAMQPVAETMGAVVRGLVDLPVPVISVVAGTAAGGGVGLALAADIVIMSPQATLKLAYSTAGLSPDCGASVELVRRAGLAGALDIVLTDRLIDADEAKRLGLATIVSDDPHASAEKLANQFGAGSFASLAAGKRLIRGVSDAYASAYEDEIRHIVQLIDSPDGREGVDAFLAKRRPHFS